MGESWIVSNLNAALSTWNDKLAEIWSLLTESPQTFKGGQVWGVMTGIHGALQAIGYGLLVLFFAVGVTLPVLYAEFPKAPLTASFFRFLSY